MILDLSLIFAWAQAITSASAASAANTSSTPPALGIVDTTIARNLGAGTDKLYLVVDCTATMVGAGATITPSLRTSATASGGALTGSPATILNGSAFAALTAAGTRQVYVLPPSSSYLQYLDVYLTLASGTLSAGKFSAYITCDVDMPAYYAEGFNPN